MECFASAHNILLALARRFDYYPPVFRKIKSMIAAVLLLGPTVGALEYPVGPSDPDYAALDVFVLRQMRKHGLPGVAIAITRGEEIAYLQGYGTAGSGVPVTPATPMFIGSQSKSFTGLAIAQLAERELLDVNAPVRNYVPWFTIADATEAAKITVSHMLHHTSGLSESGFAAELDEDAPIEAAVRALATARLSAPVGERFQYFNFGYVVLAYIVETVSGIPFAEYLSEHIFGPLQMTRTFTNRGIATSIGLAQGYSRVFGFPIPAHQPAPPYQLGSGYIISSAEDLARFAIAMNDQGRYRNTSVLSSEWAERLFSPVLGYGMGWFVGPDRVYHGGSNETFKTSVELYPDDRIGIVVLVNQGYILDHYVSTEQLMAGVRAFVLDAPLPGVRAGLSVRILGWATLALVIVLLALSIHSFARLKDWTTRAARWSIGRLTWDIALHFLVPTVFLTIVVTQLRGFYGDRFRLAYQFSFMIRNMADLGVLLVVGTIPDYLQCLIKLFRLRDRNAAD